MTFEPIDWNDDDQPAEQQMADDLPESDDVFCPHTAYPLQVTLTLIEGDMTVRHAECGRTVLTDWPYLRAHDVSLTLAYATDDQDEDWLELRVRPDEQQQDEAVEERCVCGDPNCMPYWRPVHQQMNEMRLRSDRAAADFTKAMLEEICEERTRAEQAEAERTALAKRVAELESEREADTCAVGSLLEADDEDVPRARKYLRSRFAARVAALTGDETRRGGT